jgi:hypothetical protein
LPRMPRAIELDPRHEAIAAVLARGPVPLDPPLLAALRAALDAHRLERGLEHIESVLANEQRGLEALRARTSDPPVDRTSRLLVVADDGSPRFYREVDRLLARHADRLLGMRVAAPTAAFARAIFGRELLVRAVLVTDREATTAVLFALAGTQG